MKSIIIYDFFKEQYKWNETYCLALIKAESIKAIQKLVDGLLRDEMFHAKRWIVLALKKKKNARRTL